MLDQLFNPHREWEGLRFVRIKAKVIQFDYVPIRISVPKNTLIQHLFSSDIRI